MKLRCLSLWQPHASAVALGLKPIETRGRMTWVTGQIGIHAAMMRGEGVERTFQQLCKNDVIRDGFAKAGFTTSEELPLGHIIAVADLVDSVPVRFIDLAKLPEHVRLLGNYDDGRFCWMLKDIRPLAKPIPTPGRQGFFFVEVTKNQLR